MSKQYYVQIDKCRACASTNFVDFYKTEEIPIAGIYYNNGSQKVDVRVPMTLCYCKECGLVQLKETINPDIYMNYSFIGNSSVSYEKHLEMIANKLVYDWNITGKKVYEIGASNGVLLKYLGEIGENQIGGIEPSQKLCDYALNNGINIRQGYFNTSFIGKNNIGKFDCVLIRHVLEHIDELNDMALSLRTIMEDNALLVIEVPNVMKIIEENLFSNVFHEHLNYFSLTSLNNLLFSYGFHVVYQH